MHRRCDTPSVRSYPRYGGRGIRVCERWKSFLNFLRDMGPRPSPLHSIERTDNDGNYEPSNCKWATASEQARNRSTSRKVTALGETRSLAEWSERLGVSRETIAMRLDLGWSPDRAMSQSLRKPRTLTIRGVTKTVAEWSADCSVGEEGLRYRLRHGYSPEDAVFGPRQK